MADDRPWSAAAALTLAGWPVIAAPLVDALAESDDLTIPVDVVDALSVELAGRMWQVAQASARITAHEAADQGITGTATPDRDRVDQHAATFAGLIASGYVAAAVQASLGVPLAEAGPFRAAAAKVKAAVRAALNALGVAVHGLVPTHVGAAMASAETEGRRAFYEAHPPRYLVAAETTEIDRCLPCTDINGTRYATLDEALADYPTVGYRACKGGIRCRGRLRGVWSDDPVEPRPVVPVVEADAPVRTGAMLALVPSAADAARLAVDGGEDPDELHLTLAYLGKAAQIDMPARQQLIADLGAALNGMPVIEGSAFAPAVFNPDGPEPCRVVLVGGDWLDAVHRFLTSAVPLPGGAERHVPWIPHVTVAYDGDFGALKVLTGRLGPISFDRVRLAIAGQYVDFPLVEAGADEVDEEEPDGDWSLVESEGDRDGLKRYWLGKGLKRWAVKKHPWTALYRQIRKHVTAERAQRIASQWFKDHFGYWPGSRGGKNPTGPG